MAAPADMGVGIDVARARLNVAVEATRVTWTVPRVGSRDVCVSGRALSSVRGEVHADRMDARGLEQGRHLSVTVARVQGHTNVTGDSERTLDLSVGRVSWLAKPSPSRRL